jgi:hypothetical protein
MRVNMLLKTRIIKESLGVDKFRVLIKGVKYAKKANNMFNTMTNPITVVQITQEHFPQFVACSLLSHSIIVSFLTDYHIDNEYDNICFMKDVSEGTVTVANHMIGMKDQELHRQFLVYIRLCLLIYRVFEHSANVDSSNIYICIIDYLHFITGLIVS